MKRYYIIYIFAVCIIFLMSVGFIKLHALKEENRRLKSDIVCLSEDLISIKRKLQQYQKKIGLRNTVVSAEQPVY